MLEEYDFAAASAGGYGEELPAQTPPDGMEPEAGYPSVEDMPAQDTGAAAQDPTVPAQPPETGTPEQFRRLQDEVQRLRTDERDRALLADPDSGPVYAGLRQEVLGLQQLCKERGTPVSLDAAWAAILAKELPGICRTAGENARQQALRTVRANQQATPGALGGPQTGQMPDFAEMSSREFAAYRRRILGV